MSPLDLPVTNCLAARFHLCVAVANRRSLCCVSAAVFVVILVAIFLAIARSEGRGFELSSPPVNCSYSWTML